MTMDAMGYVSERMSAWTLHCHPLIRGFLQTDREL